MYLLDGRGDGRAGRRLCRWPAKVWGYGGGRRPHVDHNRGMVADRILARATEDAAPDVPGAEHAIHQHVVHERLIDAKTVAAVGRVPRVRATVAGEHAIRV